MSQASPIAAGDDETSGEERVAVELRRRTVQTCVVAPALGALVSIECQEYAGTRTDEYEIARDRRRRVDSATRIVGPQDGVLLRTRI